jgi:hypothetical protein
VYDPAELCKFVAFFKERTKAPVPEWWATGVTDVDLFTGEHHAFVGISKKKETWAALAKKRLVVEAKGDNLLCSAGGRSVEFPKGTFRGLIDSFVGLLGEKRSVVAAYMDIGFAYEVAGFEGKGGKPVWKARVWAANRHFVAGFGYHYIEMTEKDGVVYLFGMDPHCAYVEAFDMISGKVQFRFSSCYWMFHSEAWGLK